MFNLFKEALILEVDPEETKFLHKVKTETPELYNRFYSIVRNKGLQTAKLNYLEFDKEYQKELQRKAKSNKTKENTKNLKRNISELMPNRQQVKHLLEKYFLNDDFINLCKNFNLPHISPESFTPKVNISKHACEINVVMKAHKYFTDIEEYIKSIKKQNPEIEIKRHEKNFKFLKKMKKYTSFEEEEDMDYDYYQKNSEAFKISSSLNLDIQYDDRLIAGYMRGFKLSARFTSIAHGGDFFNDSTRLYNESVFSIEKIVPIQTDSFNSEITQKYMEFVANCLKELSEKVLNKYKFRSEFLEKLAELED